MLCVVVARWCCICQ